MPDPTDAAAAAPTHSAHTPSHTGPTQVASAVVFPSPNSPLPPPPPPSPPLQTLSGPSISQIWPQTAVAARWVARNARLTLVNFTAQRYHFL